jgi:hypothetical protein
MVNSTVDILGTEYAIIIDGDKDNPKMTGSGYIECFSKEIVLKDIVADNNTFKNLNMFKQQVLRHEIVHAFVQESGLDLDRDTEEQIASWIAVQMPKMMKAMQETNCL